jgi:hypothetical protein
MEEEAIRLVLGVIILITVINTTAIWSIASTMYGQNLTQAGAAPGSLNASAAANGTPAAAAPASNSTPKAPAPKTPAANSTNASPPATLVKSYVTIETPAPPAPEKSPSLQENILEPFQRPVEGYITIFSLTEQDLDQEVPHVSFNLVNPPIIIDYNFTPMNSTDLKFLEYKSKSTMFRENRTVFRPYEQAWFEVIVRDKDTGEIVLQDGIGRTYSLQSPKQLVLQRNGLFEFEFDGDYGTVTLNMSAKKEGNIP